MGRVREKNIQIGVKKTRTANMLYRRSKPWHISVLELFLSLVPIVIVVCLCGAENVILSRRRFDTIVFAKVWQSEGHLARLDLLRTLLGGGSLD